MQAISDQEERTPWAKAFERLSEEDRKLLPLDEVERADYPEEVLREIRKSKDMCKGKQFSFKGKSFSTRDLAEKASIWVKRFQNIGDSVVQYDPVHAALPWAAVRLILQVCVP